MHTIDARTLHNGCTLLIEPMSGVRSVGICVLTPGGCAFDPVGMSGMSAMWCELLLRGAGEHDSRSQADAFDRIGASRTIDAGTFMMRIAASCLGTQVAPTLALLMDMIRRPRMDAESIEPSKDLCLQAIDSLKDDPQERAMLLARERHYPHPFALSGLGSPEGLDACDREALVAQWHRIATPAPTIIGIAGDVQAPQVIDLMERLCEGWSGSVAMPLPEPTAPRGYGHQLDASSQVQVVVLHDAPAEPHPDQLLERFVVNVLSGGMSGRLFSEVREKRGLCYSVSASYQGDKDRGAVFSYVGTTPERAQQSLDVLLEELHRINTPDGRITQEEFDRAKVGMKSGIIFSGESTGARASAIAYDQRRLGKPRTLAEVAQQVDRVTLYDVNAYLARRELGRLTIQTLGQSPLRPPASAQLI